MKTKDKRKEYLNQIDAMLKYPDLCGISPETEAKLKEQKAAIKAAIKADKKKVRKAAR